MLENVGYSKAAAKHPKRILKSQGVKEELNRLGFDVNSAKSAVVEVLNKGSNKEKILASREIFKVMGAYSPTKQETKLNIASEFEGWTPPELKLYAERGIIPDRFKETLEFLLKTSN